MSFHKKETKKIELVARPAFSPDPRAHHQAIRHRHLRPENLGRGTFAGHPSVGRHLPAGLGETQANNGTRSQQRRRGGVKQLQRLRVEDLPDCQRVERAAMFEKDQPHHPDRISGFHPKRLRRRTSRYRSRR